MPPLKKYSFEIFQAVLIYSRPTSIQRHPQPIFTRWTRKKSFIIFHRNRLFSSLGFTGCFHVGDNTDLIHWNAAKLGREIYNAFWDSIGAISTGWYASNSMLSGAVDLHHLISFIGMERLTSPTAFQPTSLDWIRSIKKRAQRHQSNLHHRDGRPSRKHDGKSWIVCEQIRWIASESLPIYADFDATIKAIKYQKIWSMSVHEGDAAVQKI